MMVKRSSNVYWIDPGHLDRLNIYVNRMHRGNCFEHCPVRGKLPIAERQRIYDELKRNIAERGFLEEHAIEIRLNRRQEADKIYQGHHRLCVALELGLEKVPVRFSYDADTQ